MIAVAVTVCLFAVGMAAFLNYFKYRSTADRIIQGRLIVIGQSIERSIQSSLALGLSFADLGMLPGLMQRERMADELILSIDVFDASGKALYSTNSLRTGRPVPEAWLAAIRRAGNADWMAGHGGDAAVGMSVQNNFGLTVGYLALRFSTEKIDRAAWAVGRELAATAFAVFAGAAALGSFALIVVMRRLRRHMQFMEQALRDSAGGASMRSLRKGVFGPALVSFFDAARSAETQIAAVRGKLDRGVLR